MQINTTFYLQNWDIWKLFNKIEIMSFSKKTQKLCIVEKNATNKKVFRITFLHFTSLYQISET